ncbi:MAG: hypothetical protein RL660_1757, partial [Bacteroidota bacterium]
MKGNKISTKQLNHNATIWLAKLLNVLTLKGYGVGQRTQLYARKWLLKRSIQKLQISRNTH